MSLVKSILDWVDEQRFPIDSCYAGIGSRGTPPLILGAMEYIGNALMEDGFVLRSGGAPGADMAFERFVNSPEDKQVFLPWKGFNGSSSSLYEPPGEAYAISSLHHPAWAFLKPPVRRLMARNAQQILGEKLDSPSKFVVCWTKDGKASGGTGQAIRIANAYNIPVFNLFRESP